MAEVGKGVSLDTPLVGWFLWLGLNTAASVLTVVALRLSQDIPALNQEQTFTLLLLGGYPLIMGIAQTSLLANYLERFAWWLPATLAGWGLGVLGVQALGRWTSLGELYPYQTIFSYGLIGLGVGLVQRFALRNSGIDGDWWMAATLTGGLLVGAIAGPQFSDIWQLVLVGALPSLLTGGVLAAGLRARMATAA